MVLIAKKLVKNTVLIQDKNGRIFFNKKTRTMSLNQRSLKAVFEHTVRECYYHENYLSDKSNWLSFQSESVNREKVLSKIVGILREAHSEIVKVLEDPVNAGDETVWAGLACDEFVKSYDGEIEYDDRHKL